MEPDGLMQERVARNEATFREANERIEASAEAYGVKEAVPFICECANPTCTDVVRLRLDQYEEVRAEPRQFLTMPGHQAALGTAEAVSERDGYLIVEKQGIAGDVAERLDERTADRPREVAADD